MIKSTVALVVVGALLAAVPAVRAQSLEPRSYSNAPVGMNFLIGGYGYTEGKVAFDPAVPLTDAHLHTNSTVFAYARSLNVWGKSAKFDVIMPYTYLSGSALLAGQPRTRKVSGFADPSLRFSLNFYGAPALPMKEFASYHQGVIVGASLQVSAPMGQYDASRLVNIGTHRWSFKSELGVSKAWGAWTVDVAPGVTFYTDNTDLLNGSTLKQDPLYALQAHLIRGFRSGIWAALDGTYYSGARTTVNGVRGSTELSNTRAGLTVALPVGRLNSLKLYASAGTSSRTKSNFNAVGVAWQYRWGGGI